MVTTKYRELQQNGNVYRKKSFIINSNGDIFNKINNVNVCVIEGRKIEVRLIDSFVKLLKEE